jgi:hypothetical protein
MDKIIIAKMGIEGGGCTVYGQQVDSVWSLLASWEHPWISTKTTTRCGDSGNPNQSQTSSTPYPKFGGACTSLACIPISSNNSVRHLRGTIATRLG